jgi:N6-adenosine-specific RNA methylase IME4
VAARLATLKDGQRQVGKFAYVPTQEQAAKLAGVSERSVKSAKVVLERGTAELQQAVERGRIAVHEAEKAARHSPEAQDEFLAAVAAGKAPSAWQNNYSRKSRAAALAATTRALPAQKWPLLLADPPWNFHVWSPDKLTSHPANEYPVMSHDEICALPISGLAADDCVLFMWTTGPCLEEAFAVLKAWGFEYKSQLVWDKEIPGMGFWARGQHEPLLIATRGNPPLPPQEAVPASVIRERRREHSRKPEASYTIIECMYPDLPKLELFARQARPGWDVWGNETGKFTADKGVSK